MRRVASGFKKVEELCPDCKGLEGFSIKDGIETDGIYLNIKDEKRKEAEMALKQ